MRQFTESERVAMEKAWDKNFKDEPALSFYDSLEAGFAAALNHSDKQIAALTAELDGLRALVRRVKAMGDRLSDDEIYNRLADAYENGQSLELIQLLTDCQEALK